MNEKEFGIWMMENLELGSQVYQELLEAGKLEPETSHEAIKRNAVKLILEFKSRFPERFLDQQAEVN
jgi:hypothetical protein